MTMKAYIVNREQDVDRRDFMLPQMKSLQSFDYSIFRAVDKNEIDQETIRHAYSEEQTIKNIKRPLSTGEICCALSHLAIYSILAREEKNAFFIFEDDVLISPLLCRLAPLLHSFSCRNDPTLILLTPVHCFTKAPVKLFLRQSESGEKSDFLGKPFPAYSIHNTIGASSTAGYLINSAAAKVMIKLYSPITSAIDNWKKRIDCHDIHIYNLSYYLVSLNKYGRGQTGLKKERQENGMVREEGKNTSTLYSKLYGKYWKCRKMLCPPHGHEETW